MNSIESTIPHNIPMLDEDPSLHIHHWLRAVNQYAFRIGTDLPLRSLLGYGITYSLAQHQKACELKHRAANELIADPTERAAALAAPYVFNPPALPAPLPHPAANASAAVVRTYEENKDHVNSFNKSMATLSFVIFSRLSSSINTTIFNLYGVEVTIVDALQFLRDTYGTPTEQSLKLATSKLEAKITSEERFQHEATEKKELLLYFESAHQAIGTVAQIEYLFHASSNFPTIQAAIQQYKLDVKLLDRRSFDAAVAYVMQYKDSITPTAATSGYLNAATAPGTTTRSVDISHLATTIDALVASAFAKHSASPPTSTTNNRRSGQGKKKSGKSCSIHGPGHSDDACRVQHPELATKI
jgi:hypothetical protein